MYDCHINKLGVIFLSSFFLLVFLLDFNFNQQSCPVIGTLYWGYNSFCLNGMYVFVFIILIANHVCVKIVVKSVKLEQ